MITCCTKTQVSANNCLNFKRAIQSMLDDGARPEKATASPAPSANVFAWLKGIFGLAMF